MTSPDPFAEAVVQARLEWGDLDGEFEARVRAATEKAAQAARKQLARIQLVAKVKLDADVPLFGRETQAKLRQLSLSATVKLNADTSEFRSEVRAATEGLSGVTVRVGLDVSAAEVRRFATDLNARLAAADIRVPVGIDLDEAGYRARLALLTRPVTQTVNINTNGGGASGGLSSLNSGLDGTNSRGRKLRTTGIAGLIAAIGGAAGLAAGAVGALAAGIGAIGLAAGAGLATAVVGMQGIGDAFSAFSDQTASAGADAKAQGKAVEAAAKQMESAEKAVASANKGSLDAQKDLNEAREDATRSIEDVNFALKGTAIDEKDAALALARAREAYDQTFGDPTATGLDRAEAALGIDKALRRQDEVARRNNDLIEQAAEANAKGVEGSDEVVAAKEKIVEADERVAEANDQLLEATEAMNEALNGTTAAADKVAEALAKLSPNARAFVLAMRDLGPAWKDLKLSVQDAMFADLDSVFTNLANATLPTLKTGMTDVGGAINGAAKEFANFWSSADAQDGIRDIFAGTADFITAMQPGLRQASEGILAIGTAAAPVMDEVGAAIGGLLGNVMQAFTDAANSGALTQLISTFADIMDGFGEGLNGLLDGLIEFGNIVGPVIGPLLKSLGEGLGALAPSLGALGVSFGESLITLMPFLVNFISAIADGLVPVMPVLATLFAALMTAVTPLIQPLSDILVVIGQALVEAIAALAPAIGPLGEAFASLITALAPILPVIAEVISQLVQALAPALTTIFDALGPVIEQFLTGMAPVLEQLAPILADVAMQLGTAIADALVQITPLLPTLIDSFSRIILALAPFIPQLVQISVDLLPVLIDLFMVLVETVLPPITAAIEFLAVYVLPLVIEGIRSFAEVWSERLTSVKDSIQSARDFIGGAVDGIAGFFSTLGDKISSVWGAIVSTIKSAVGEIGKFLTSLPEIKIPDLPGVPGRGTTIGFKNIGTSMVNWATAAPAEAKATGTNLQKVPGRAQGGVFKGAGGPTDDANLIRISNKEHLAFITRAAATNSDTLPFLDAINNGWVPPAGLLHAMVPGYKDGGVVDGLASYVKTKFPELQMTSGLRSGDSGYHGQGMAADFSNGSGNTDEQLAFANHMASKYKSQIKELIYDDPRFTNQIKDGEFVGKEFYANAGDHTNHVHVAMAAPPSVIDPGVMDQDPAEDTRTNKQKYVDAVVAEGKARGVSDKGIRIAVATMLAESGGQMYANEADPESMNYAHDAVGSDHDSSGLFQQRDNGAWGTTADRMDPAKSAGMFYEELAKQDYENMDPALAAQAVQRSAFSDGSNYRAQLSEADQLVDESYSRGTPEGSAAASTGSGSAGMGDGSAQSVFVTNWPSGGDTSYLPGGSSLSSSASSAASTLSSSPSPSSTSTTPGATSRMGGFDSTYYGDTAQYGGIAGANDWASRQDFQSQFNSWGIDALKEIGGELFSPLGLDSAWGGLVDRGASELSRMGAPASSQAGEYQQVVFNNSFVGMDPNKVSAELERQFQPGTAVAGRYRGN